jgi:hypothetical protein
MDTLTKLLEIAWDAYAVSLRNGDSVQQTYYLLEAMQIQVKMTKSVGFLTNFSFYF